MKIRHHLHFLSQDLFFSSFILLTNVIECIALCQALGLEKDELNLYLHAAKSLEQEADNKHRSK